MADNFLSQIWRCSGYFPGKRLLDYCCGRPMANSIPHFVGTWYYCTASSSRLTYIYILYRHRYSVKACVQWQKWTELNWLCTLH